MSVLARQMNERRERILSAAREIISTRGFERLTMRNLAQASGVTVPTVYNLIGSRKQVLFAVVEEQMRHFGANLTRQVGDVIAIVDANAHELLRMPRYYRALLPLLLTSDAAQPARRRAAQMIRTQLRTALGELAEEGEIESWVDLDALQKRIQSHIEMTSLQWSLGGIPDERLRDITAYEAALLLLGVTRGKTRATLEQVAREAQATRSPEPGVLSLGAER